MKREALVMCEEVMCKEVVAQQSVDPDHHDRLSKRVEKKVNKI